MQQLGTIRLKCRRKKAEIDIDGVIGVPEWWELDVEQQRAVTYEEFRAVVDQISELDVQSVTVNIRSLGGNMADALLIYEALRSLDAEITTRCYGYTASAATVIAQAASVGRREISAGTLYLIHRSMTSATGNTADLERGIDLLAKTDDTIASIYAASSDKPKEYYLEIMSRQACRGEWLSAAETIAASLADRIIEPVSAGITSPDNAEYFGYPAIPVAKSIGSLSAYGARRTLWQKMTSSLGLSSGAPEIVSAAYPDTSAVETESEKARAVTLETMSRRAAALATATQPKEDPSIDGSKPMSNQTSYEEDVKQFK